MDVLLNWLWQGGVVAIAAMGMLQLLDRARATVRCWVCWGALVVVAILPLAALVIAAFSPAGLMEASAATVTVPSAWWTSDAIVASAWAIWAGANLVRLAGAVVVVRRARACVSAFPAATAPLLMHWQRVHAAGRSARLVLSDRVQAAAVFGCGDPVIAVAPALVDRLDSSELDRVVIHEWAHVQRRDDLAKLAQLLVRVVAGWHPAVWWLERRLSIEQELACDETVVAVSGGAKAYASCLVKLASLRSTHSDAVLATGALASAGLRRRVARLLARKEFVSAAWSRRAAALVVSLLVVLGLGIPQVRFVEAAVSATVVQVLHPVGQTLSSVTDKADTPAAQQRLSRETRRAIPQSDRSSAAAIDSAQRTFANAPGTASGAADVPRPGVEAEVLSARGEESVARASATDASPSAVEPETTPLVALPSRVTVAPPPTVNKDSRSVWSPAADAGTAIGRKSKEAGLATAGAFTRFAKKIGGSF